MTGSEHIGAIRTRATGTGALVTGAGAGDHIGRVDPHRRRRRRCNPCSAPETPTSPARRRRRPAPCRASGSSPRHSRGDRTFRSVRTHHGHRGDRPAGGALSPQQHQQQARRDCTAVNDFIRSLRVALQDRPSLGKPCFPRQARRPVWESERKGSPGGRRAWSRPVPNLLLVPIVSRSAAGIAITYRPLRGLPPGHDRLDDRLGQARRHAPRRPSRRYDPPRRRRRARGAARRAPARPEAPVPSVTSRTAAPASSRRPRSAASGSRRAAGGWAPRRSGERNGPSRWTPGDRGAASSGTSRSAATSRSSGAVINVGRNEVTPVASSASPARR